MRDFLDAILEAITAESLTDEEFDFAEIQALGEDEEYTEEMYKALRLVLDTREAVSDLTTRLKGFFQMKGVTVGSVKAAVNATNILIGAAL